MACYRPLKGWKSRSVSDKGKHGITFRRSEAFVDLPMEVACGQCIGCRLDRVRDWATRLVYESKSHVRSAFLTLTYSGENLPEGGTLVKSHVQAFMKRLRKAHPELRMRFFLCGEYGGRFGRPHYHVILFGYDFSGDRVKHSGTDADTLYVSSELDRLWGKGFCSIGSVTVDSAKYVASYVVDKITGEDSKAHYEVVIPATGVIVDRVPPFVLMSRRPGIGRDFVDRFGSDLYPGDFAVVRGRQLPVPKYFDRVFSERDPEMIADIKAARVRRAAARRADNTPERLAVREDVAKARRRVASSGIL